MKTIRSRSEDEIELKSIRIDVSDILDILSEMTDEGTEFALTIGNSWDDVRYELESISEARRHAQLIQIPFAVCLGGIRLRISKHSAKITYRTEDLAIAHSLERKLRSFSHPLQILTKPWAPTVFAFPIIILVDWYFNFSADDIFPFLWSAFLIIGPLTYLSIVVDRPTLLHRRSKGFIARNFDQIALLLIGAVLGWAVSVFSPLGAGPGDAVKEAPLEEPLDGG